MSVIERLKGIFTKSFAVVVVIVIAIGVTVGFFTSRRRQWLETNATRKLGEIGIAELYFADANPVHDYGTFEDLVSNGFLSTSSERSDFIEGFEIAAFTIDQPYPSIIANLSSNYTVIAIPLNRTLGLRTFSICEDQTIRVASDVLPGGSSFDGANPCRWEPLR